MFTTIKKFLKLYLFRFKYIGKKVVFAHSCSVGVKSQFEGLNIIGTKSSIDGYLGYGSYIGSNSNINGRIGKYCSIASNVNVLTGTHPVTEFVSTHPVFFSLNKQNGTTYVTSQLFMEKLYADKDKKYGIVVGNDVWIGYGVTIIGGIQIGDGAVLLANTIVTRDVPPYSIVGGIPAKVVNKRFDEQTIQFLLEFKWWDKPESWIRQNVRLFSDIEMFKKENRK